MTEYEKSFEATIDDLDLNSEPTIHVAINNIRKPYGWKSKEMSERAFFELISKHRIGPKEGRAFLPAVLVGDRRTAKAVKAMHALVYDVDDGTPLEELVERVKNAGWMACIYTSHSHGQTCTKVPVEAVSAFIRKAESRDFCDDEDVLRYLKEEKGFHASVLNDATVTGKSHTEIGVAFTVMHDPKTKARIVCLPKTPCVIAELASSRPTDAWKAIYQNVDNHLGINFDASCSDPSRAFYLPRHDEEAP